ncbi:MAG: 3-oxoacyl-ACP reductase family protein [Nitrososphaerales archaeon]|jgi:3-oxoacyl-[acyl-carrier protein] reductase
MAQRLEGKVALVTGASRGIGAAIARAFASEGASVTVNYHSSEAAARAVAEEIRGSGGKALLVRADVTKTAEVKRMVSEAVLGFGRVDILINNAGILISKDFLESTDEDWDRVLDTNLKSAYLCSREVAPMMLAQKSGKIINISSVSGLAQPSAMKCPDYVSSKTGLIGLTRALAVRLAPLVNVNAICPGATETDMLSWMSPDVKRRIADEALLKRVGRPSEIAAAATFLASEDASWITGEVLTVSGGRAMR